MLRTQVRFLAAAGAVAAIAGLAAIPLALDAQQPVAHHPVPASKHGGVVVMLCDGKTSVEIKGLKPGQRMSHDQASAVARNLMASWQRDHPGQRWETAQAQSPAEPTGAQSPPSESAAPAKAPAAAEQQVQGVPVGPQAQPQQQGDTYASFHERDFKVWQAETQKFVEEGKRIFHSDKLLGGTIGVSCDMCHPDASNTRCSCSAWRCCAT
jgi:thiosulfate dehydrogenase